MKYARYLSLLTAVAVICLTFASCGADNNNVQDKSASAGTLQSEKAIDNTEQSENHDKIYYYNDSSNVAYEISGCFDCCFMTPYLAAQPTGGAILVFPGGGYNHLSNDSNKKGSDSDGDQ